MMCDKNVSKALIFFILRILSCPKAGCRICVSSMKLLIATVSNRDWKFEFGSSFFDLGVSIARSGINFGRYSLDNCSNLCYSRQLTVFKAIDEKFSHLFLLDDDMNFTPQAFQSLMQRDKDLVTANYLTKKEQRPTAIDFDEKPIYSSGKDGIEKIKTAGLGFVLIKTEALKKISSPHFSMTMEINSAQGKTKISNTSEDKYFYHKALEAGAELYVDHNASKHISHIGKTNFQEKF